jgi:hypothetical protein
MDPPSPGLAISRCSARMLHIRFERRRRNSSDRQHGIGYPEVRDAEGTVRDGPAPMTSGDVRPGAAGDLASPRERPLVDKRAGDLSTVEFVRLAELCAEHVGDDEELGALATIDATAPSSRERLGLSLEWSRQHRLWLDAPGAWRAFLFGDAPDLRGRQGHPAPDLPAETREQMIRGAEEVYRAEAAWQLDVLDAIRDGRAGESVDIRAKSVPPPRPLESLPAKPGFSRRAYTAVGQVRRHLR